MRLTHTDELDIAEQKGWEKGYTEGCLDEMKRLANKLRDYVSEHPNSASLFLEFIDSLENDS